MPMIARLSAWIRRLRLTVPSREGLAAHPWLRPVGGRLLAPELWRFQQESVARGVAVGLFWAFVLPAAQMVVAALHCSWCRGNIPSAVAATMVTNPFTIGFWLWLAYRLGSLVLGPAGGAEAVEAGWLASFGAPTLVGMAIFAVGGALLAYLAVKLGWRLYITLKRRRRAASLKPGQRA